MRFKAFPMLRRRKINREDIHMATKNPRLLLAKSKAEVRKIAQNKRKIKTPIIKFVSGGILRNT
jgi:hypothetical protein